MPPFTLITLSVRHLPTCESGGDMRITQLNRIESDRKKGQIRRREERYETAPKRAPYASRMDSRGTKPPQGTSSSSRKPLYPCLFFAALRNDRSVWASFARSASRHTRTGTSWLQAVVVLRKRARETKTGLDRTGLAVCTT